MACKIVKVKISRFKTLGQNGNINISRFAAVIAPARAHWATCLDRLIATYFAKET